ncbi:MAG: hypothetical protein ACSLE1_03310 [Sphingobium sp.]
MKFDKIFEPRRPRAYVVLDIESAVLDDTAHKRYQAMERWVPTSEAELGRRGYRRSDDPLITPRWPFQTIVTAAIMLLVEHGEGNVDVARFVTLSAPDLDEREVLAGIVQVLADAPEGAEIVTYGGSMHDLPMILMGLLKHGLTLPRRWQWLSHGAVGITPHIDFSRTVTGGYRMKPVHEAEILAALDIPAKVPAPAFAVSGLIYAGEWETVASQCEFDVIATSLLLARWKKLHDPRVEVPVFEDRILRRVIELREGRGYIPALQARRKRIFAQQTATAEQAMGVLAPWLQNEA